MFSFLPLTHDNGNQLEYGGSEKMGKLPDLSFNVFKHTPESFNT